MGRKWYNRRRGGGARAKSGTTGKLAGFKPRVFWGFLTRAGRPRMGGGTDREQGIGAGVPCGSHQSTVVRGQGRAGTHARGMLGENGKRQARSVQACFTFGKLEGRGAAAARALARTAGAQRPSPYACSALSRLPRCSHAAASARVLAALRLRRCGQITSNRRVRSHQVTSDHRK